MSEMLRDNDVVLCCEYKGGNGKHEGMVIDVKDKDVFQKYAYDDHLLAGGVSQKPYTLEVDKKQIVLKNMHLNSKTFISDNILDNNDVPERCIPQTIIGGLKFTLFFILSNLLNLVL